MTDLKSGYLLGAHPRKQFLAQFSGVFLGTLVTVGVFKLLVPDASVLGSTQFPAPAAQTWRAVAEAMADISKLHPIKLWSVAIGGTIGLILPLLSMALPRIAVYIPSPAAMGLAWTFPFYNSLYFFIGGLIAWWLEKRHPKLHEQYTFPVASGWIAGESLMGSALVIWEKRSGDHQAVEQLGNDRPGGDRAGGRAAISRDGVPAVRYPSRVAGDVKIGPPERTQFSPGASCLVYAPSVTQLCGGGGGPPGPWP